VSLYTLNREDFRDFEVCPKIVSIKAYRELHPPPRPAGPTVPRTPAQAMFGKAGEAAFEATFATGKEPAGKPLDFEAERRRIEREILKRLAAYRGWIDAAVRQIIEDTARGMLQVRKSYQEAYGNLDLLGRGESQNGIAPCTTRFDFVAIRSARTPVIVEVKNTAGHLKPADRFQASFYNSLSERYGVVIRSDSIESGNLVLRPTQVRDIGVETLLVDSREGTFEVIRERTDVSPSRVKAVWEAKQLGYLGKTVETECVSNCRHLRYLRDGSIHLAESSLEPYPPLPLAYGRSMLESGVNPATIYYRRLLHNPPYVDVWREFHHSFYLTHDKPAKRKEILEITADHLGLDPSVFDLLLSPGGRTTVKSLEKSIRTDLDNWSKLVGKKRTKTARTGGLGTAHRVYGLPIESERFVRDCDAEWA
jgi:hypothetical protein